MTLTKKFIRNPPYYPVRGRLNVAVNMNMDLIYRKVMLSFLVNISLLLDAIVKPQRNKA